MEDVGVNDVDGVKTLFKELVDTVLENRLEGELEEELGYSKYDYRNKATDNSLTAIPRKRLPGSFGDMKFFVPRDRNGDFEPKLVKKRQISLTGDIEEKIISIYAKGMTKSDIESHARLTGLMLVEALSAA